MATYEIICQRGSVGTQIKGGIYKLCGPNEPRFEDDGLLIESIKTNKVPNSNQLVAYSSAGTVTPEVVKGFPLLRCERTSSTGDFRNTFTYTKQQLAHLFSFVSDKELTACTLHFTKAGQDSRTLARGDMVSLGNGLYRCSTRIPAGFLDTDDGWHLSIVLTTTEGLPLRIGCFQLEEGDFLTSIIPTNGEPVQRDRDYFQIKNLPTSGNFVYHFHWKGHNTPKGRFEVLAYENPLKRDKYRLVRLWREVEGKLRNKFTTVWNTIQSSAAGSLDPSTDEFKLDLQGDGTAVNLFIQNKAYLEVPMEVASTHGQLALRGTIELPGDDPETEGYAYHLKDFQIYDRTLSEEDLAKLDTASPPEGRLFHAPLQENLDCSRKGHAWIPDFTGNVNMLVPAWDPVGGDVDFGDFEIDLVFEIDTLDSTQYLFDSRPASTHYCFYDASSKTIKHTFESSLVTVNGYRDFVFEKTGKYHLTISQARTEGYILNKLGSSSTDSEYLQGKIHSARLRDLQFDIADPTGAENKSRYYDFIQWTDTNTAPTNTNIPDVWNLGSNQGTLSTARWVPFTEYSKESLVDGLL